MRLGFQPSGILNKELIAGRTIYSRPAPILPEVDLTAPPPPLPRTLLQWLGVAWHGVAWRGVALSRAAGAAEFTVVLFSFTPVCLGNMLVETKIRHSKAPQAARPAPPPQRCQWRVATSET